MIESDKAAQQMVGGPCREKYWDERKPEEQLEALRSSCIQLHHIVASLQDAFQVFAMHQHGADGRLLVPMDQREKSRGWTPISLTSSSVEQLGAKGRSEYR
jgi:hypothetical protein